MTLLQRHVLLIVFVLIVSAIFIAAILVGLGLFEKADPDLFKWLIGTGGTGILSTLLWAFRDAFRSKGRISVNIVFVGVSPDAVELDADQCSYEVRDGTSNEMKDGGKLVPTLGLGGWQCILPSTVSHTDYIRLILTGRQGDRWEVGWFLPLVTTKEAVRI